MKKAMKSALVFAVPFGVLVGLATSSEDPAWRASLYGVVAFAGTLVAVGAYIHWRAREFREWAAKMYAPYEHEGIVMSSRAVVGDTGNALAVAALVVSPAAANRLDATGVLVLTGHRLLFVPLRARVHTRLDIPLSEILAVGPGYGFTRRTIRIGTSAQTIFHFKLDDDRDKWLASLPGERLPAAGTSAPAT